MQPCRSGRIRELAPQVISECGQVTPDRRTTRNPRKPVELCEFRASHWPGRWCRQRSPCPVSQSPPHAPGGQPRGTGAGSRRDGAGGTRRSSGCGERTAAEHAEGHILVQPARNPARREHTGGIGMDQHRDHHPRLIRAVVATVADVGKAERGEVHLPATCPGSGTPGGPRVASRACQPAAA